MGRTSSTYGETKNMYNISVKNVNDNDHWIYLTDQSVVAGSYKHGNESRGFSKANRLAEEPG
jgi:hypothetical protein